MSFRCQFCGKAQPAGTKPVKVVTKVRRREGRVRVIDNFTAEWLEPREIVEEKMACLECAGNAPESEIVESFIQNKQGLRNNGRNGEKEQSTIKKGGAGW